MLFLSILLLLLLQLQLQKFEFLYDEVPRLPPVLPWGSWQEVAGAGSQGTEPRSMIWDGTLTDSYMKPLHLTLAVNPNVPCSGSEVPQ